jgi:hypothetical protein
MSCPVREMCPSGHRHTTSPAFSAFTANRMPSSGLAGEIGIAPPSRKHQSKNRRARNALCPT